MGSGIKISLKSGLRDQNYLKNSGIIKMKIYHVVSLPKGLLPPMTNDGDVKLIQIYSNQL